MAERARIIGGPFDGQSVLLKQTPERITTAHLTYHRVDDPDTGEFLGAYAIETQETDS